MKSNDRGLGGIIGVALLLLAGFLIQGCDQPGSDFAQTIRREWVSTGADGQDDRILFEQEQILWGYETKNQYGCPYRVLSFSEKTRIIDINLRCKKRTGTDEPVGYRLTLSEDRQSLEVKLEGRIISLFKAAPTRG